MNLMTPINSDLEKHLLAGCKIIQCKSVDYNTSNGSITHILLECPKEYLLDEERKVFTRFIIEEVLSEKWYDATMIFTDRRNALRIFQENVSEDRVAKMRTTKAA